MAHLIQPFMFNKGLTFIGLYLTGGMVFVDEVCRVRLNSLSLTQNLIENEKINVFRCIGHGCQCRI